MTQPSGWGVAGLGQTDRVAQHRRRRGRGRDARQLHDVAGRDQVSVDRRGTHRAQLGERRRRRERSLQITGFFRQRQLSRPPYFLCGMAHQRPDMLQRCPCLVAALLRSQPAPVDLRGRVWQRRASQHPPSSRPAHPGRRDHLVEDPGLLGLRRLPVCSTELVGDAFSRPLGFCLPHGKASKLKKAESRRPLD